MCLVVINSRANAVSIGRTRVQLTSHATIHQRREVTGGATLTRGGRQLLGTLQRTVGPALVATTAAATACLLLVTAACLFTRAATRRACRLARSPLLTRSRCRCRCVTAVTVTRAVTQGAASKRRESTGGGGCGCAAAYTAGRRGCESRPWSQGAKRAAATGQRCASCSAATQGFQRTTAERRGRHGERGVVPTAHFENGSRQCSVQVELAGYVAILCPFRSTR